MAYPVPKTRRSDKRSVQQPIPIPRDYVPISFPSGDERYRGRSSSRPYHVESRPPQFTSADPYIPSSNDYQSRGYDNRYSSGSRLDDRYHRSSSQQPRGPTSASPYIPSSNYYPSSKNHEYDNRYSSGSPSRLDDRYRRSSSQQPRGSTSASPWIPSSNYYPGSKSHGYDNQYSSGSPSPLDDRHRRSSSQQPRDSTSANPYYYPSSKSHGNDNRYSSDPRLDNRHHRSSSQQPRGSDRYRPTYSRRRSHSYDFPSIGHPSRTSAPTRNHGVLSAATETMRTIRASETLPTFVHPSHKHPLIVPINNGRNGWVVLPANGEEVRVMDPSGSKTVHPLSSSKQGSRFFGGFNFGSKHHSKTRSGKHERAKPVTQAMINPFRRRRDSY